MQAAGQRFIWHGSKTDEIKLVYFSDIHWLAKACAESSVRKQIAEILEDPYTFWIGGGDYGEFIGFGDTKRFDPDAVADHVKVSDLGQLGRMTYEQIAGLFRPIKHKCLGLIVGNHEKQYMRRMQQEDLHGWLCIELGVPNLGYSCFMDVVFCRCTDWDLPVLTGKRPPRRGEHRHASTETFRVFCHHGKGAAQTKGGKVNALVSFMRSFEADIYFMGHVHDQMGVRLTPLTANRDCTELTNKTKLGVISGSFLKAYPQGHTTYAEVKGYEPTTLGAAWVKIRPYTRELWGRV